MTVKEKVLAGYYTARRQPVGKPPTRPADSTSEIAMERFRQEQALYVNACQTQQEKYTAERAQRASEFRIDLLAELRDTLRGIPMPEDSRVPELILDLAVELRGTQSRMQVIDLAHFLVQQVKAFLAAAAVDMATEHTALTERQAHFAAIFDGVAASVDKIDAALPTTLETLLVE